MALFGTRLLIDNVDQGPVAPSGSRVLPATAAASTP